MTTPHDNLEAAILHLLEVIRKRMSKPPVS